MKSGSFRRLGAQAEPSAGQDEFVAGGKQREDFVPRHSAKLVARDRRLDGASWLPLLSGQPIERTTPLYWHFLRASSSVKVAIREGDWKLVARMEGPGLKPSGAITEEEITINKTAELTGFELFNLREDIAETTDLSSTETARFEGMKEQLLKKYHEVREESPVWPAWEFARYEGQRIEWPDYKALIKPPVYVP